MSNLLNSLSKWFSPTLHSDIERYVSSKNPSSPAEVDYWIRQYDYQRPNFFGGKV